MSKLPNTFAGVFICVYSISALLFSSCVPHQPEPEKAAVASPSATSAQEKPAEGSMPSPILVENTPTKVVITPTITEIPAETPTETPEPTATVQVESNIPKNVPTEKNENFDFNATDLLNWNEYQLVEVETLDVSETVETAYEGENHLYLMPLIDQEAPGLEPFFIVEKLTLPPGYTFGIKEKRLVKNENGEMLTLGVVADNFGYNTFTTRFVVLLNGTDSNGEVQGFVKEKGAGDMVTFITDLERDKVGEVQEELKVLQLLSEYQEQIGGFTSGEEISLYDIIQPEENLVKAKDISHKTYFLGSRYLASALNRLSLKDNSLITKLESKHFMLGVIPGPLAMESGDWLRAIGPKEGEDFIFQINGDNPETRYYFEIQPIFANINIPESVEKWGHPFEPDDSRIIHGATIRLVEDLPEGQVEVLKELSRNYNNYIANNATIPMIIPQGITMEKYFLLGNHRNVKRMFGKDSVFQYVSDDDLTQYLTTISD